MYADQINIISRGTLVIDLGILIAFFEINILHALLIVSRTLSLTEFACLYFMNIQLQK